MERSLRHHVDTTGTPVTGWDKKTTDRPTALMLVTKFSGLMVVTVDQQRHLARALSSVQQPDLTALSGQATGAPPPPGGRTTGRGGNTPGLTGSTEAVRVGCGSPADRRVDIAPSPGVGPCPPGPPGPSPSSSWPRQPGAGRRSVVRLVGRQATSSSSPQAHIGGLCLRDSGDSGESSTQTAHGTGCSRPPSEASQKGFRTV